MATEEGFNSNLYDSKYDSLMVKTKNRGKNYHYWESELYRKTFFRKDVENKGMTYHDTSSVFRFIFFHWVNKWVNYLSESFIEPYKLHPLPVADQVLYWQPIFSKHVSDGLYRLESYETLRSRPDVAKKRPYKSILVRALVLTFWKRLTVALVGIVVTNVLSLSISILVKKLLQIMGSGKFHTINVVLLLAAVVLLQMADGLIMDNFNYYMFRVVYIVQYLFSIGMFQHGLCYRRKYFNNVDGSNSLNVCNSVLHSFSPDSSCSMNPLYCPARRYQNKDITPRIFSFESIDSYLLSLFYESMINVFTFLTNFFFGILFMSFQIRVNLWVLYVVGLFFVFLMIFVEVVNTFVLHFIFHIRDYRISKCIEIISGLQLINRMLCDDIGYNIITSARNIELSMFLIRMFLTFFNRSLYIICMNISFYVFKKYFVKSINDADVITDIDTAGFLASLYIFLKIIDSMNILPHAIKRITTAYVSFNRIKLFTDKCSPNFYISDNKFVGSTHMSSDVNDVTEELGKDVVVLYKNASFSWVNSRADYLEMNFEPFLRNLNFELKRGEAAIVTGGLGSGKSNFIKSALGEMTLVGGSMAVVPLHTSMPIFYASQDIWLQQGTIRSNITFGYKFDEEVYNTVLKTVELESDVSSWEDGDLRIVSDYAYCLSGGQRVRMEMARALYAYLIFNKVNREYNNNQCSFLMCLDSPFDALDPFVAKTIFNNLFNLESGLLVKGDLSVILTSSKRSLDKCTSSCDLGKLSNMPVYRIKHDSLSFLCTLADFVNCNRQSGPLVQKALSQPGGPYHMNFFSTDMFDLCSSGSNTRSGRRSVTVSKYEHSFNSYIRDELSGVKFNPFLIYFTPAMTTFVIFILITLILTIMDNVKFVFVTNLSDYITSKINDFNDGIYVDFSEVKARSISSLKFLFIFVMLIIFLSLFSILFLSLSCIISSRKIHEYCLNSIFENNSSVIKIKKQISQVITFLSCDIFQIDESLGYSISTSLMSLIDTIIHIGTLFYLIPISVPFISISLFVIYRFVFLKYIKSSKNLQLSSLESMTHMNAVCESAISGSSIYRSFKKEWEFMHNIIEHTEYYMRCRFLNKAMVTWSTISSNWTFLVTTLFVLFIPILFDKFTRYKLKVGYFGLALSLSMKVIKSFTNFLLDVARMEIYMCSIHRIQCFIPPGAKCVFGKFYDMHQEYLPVNIRDDYKIDKARLMKRRLDEFLSDNEKLQNFKKIFYKPKITFIDVTKYVTPEHVGVKLQNVSVSTSANVENEKSLILNNITASAYSSDMIGFIGRTGAGKTTLLSVLQNSMSNRTGSVLLDGTDLNDIPRAVLRQIIGVLPQLPFVFKGWTVRRFLDPRKLFTDDEINQALDDCGLLDFVNDLLGGRKLDSVIIPEDVSLKYHLDIPPKPSNKISKTFKSERSLTLDNLKTYYEDNDMLFSSTQLRTLSFARLVLYRKFYRMILVDEPPSDETEQRDEAEERTIKIPIYELLKKYFKHCTTFVTAHDAKALRMCTSVWVIHSGCLIRTCKTEEILTSESISNIIEECLKTVNK